ncbi:MAG: YkgJ family cysteine cluster protein [Treponema sp.]|nr:YkgJ family cysteine cluster protein [Treponema sp.]
MGNTRFYASGLKFSCKRCSTCCRYEAGFVYLSEKDLKNLTSLLNIERNDFIAAYCRWVSDVKGGEALSLKEKPNYDCIFWDSGCTVYSARPLQCVTFPFWENVLASESSWKMAASGCSGINSGDIHTENAINEIIKMRTSEPLIYRNV